METLNGAQILVRTLIDQGVDTVFGYPGGTVIDIYDALFRYQDEITHIETTHEQHAAHAADGYARATGKVGVVLATSGPGATNLVTGIATAYLDSVPVVAITGNVGTANIGTDSFQELDITGVTLPITKHNYFVRSVDDLQGVVREAFMLAMSGRPGPVLIDIPKDVQVGIAAYQPAPPTGPAVHIAPPQADLAEAAAAINASERPYVYFGGGVIASNAGGEVVELAERLDAPIGCSLMGISGVPTNHPLFLGMQGMHGHFASSMAMHHADCVIALGARFNDRVTGDRSKFSPNTKIVRVDIDSSELSKTTEDRVEVCGDVKVALKGLLPLVERNTHSEWRRLVKEFRAQEKGYADYREGTLTPACVMEVVNRHLAPQTRVVTDVGQHQMWAAQHLRFSQPRTFVSSGGLGTMGFGMGAAIGAQMGTGEHALLVTGDGSFAMNLAELITAADHQVPLTVLLLNNGVLGMVRQWQSLFYGKRYSNTMLDRRVDYVRLAEACGCEAHRVASLDELDATLGAALEKAGPTLIECPIDKDEFVVPMLPPGGATDDMIVNADDVRAKMGR